LSRVWSKYDKTFIVVYNLQYFNAGLKVLLSLATLDLFNHYMSLEPVQVAFYNMVIYLPWSFKWIYGVITDTVPLFGSRKRSWLMIMGVAQTISLLTLVVGEFTTPLPVVALLFTANITGAFMDVVCDAIMVIQAKQDPLNGSSELQSMAWASQGVAMIIGSILGGYFTEKLHPSYCFGFEGCFGILVSLNAFCL
jgi:MFS family permease